MRALSSRGSDDRGRPCGSSRFWYLTNPDITQQRPNMNSSVRRALVQLCEPTIGHSIGCSTSWVSPLQRLRLKFSQVGIGIVAPVDV